MAKVKGKTKFGFYPSYKFRDHDPILDQIDTLHEMTAGQFGTDKPITFAALSARSGVSITTLQNWSKRKTKRPQFATIKAVAQAMGGTLTIVYQGREIDTRPTRASNVVPITRGKRRRHA